MAIEPRRFGNHFEAVIDMVGRFRVAKEQDAVFAQREMEQRDDLRLCFRAQVDQEVPAGNQVEPRERRVGQEVLYREDHRRAQLGSNLVAVVLLGKEACQPRRRDVRLDRRRV